LREEMINRGDPDDGKFLEYIDKLRE